MTSTGPLQGITILDLTRVLAGPYCTMILADLGARVIKVELPETGDDSRQFGPFQHKKSAYFMSLNRGKESIALDLKTQEDRILFDALLSQSDILIENFRPGTLSKWGYAWDSLHKKYPELIVAAISGFGQTGPYANRPAYDLVMQAMGGLMSITGHPNTPPTRVGTSIGDIAAALFTANGIQSALYHREKTGQGMFVDVAMLDCQVALLENAIARTYATERAPQPLGARHPSITPFDAYATKDGHIVVAAGNDALFETLCKTIHREDLCKNEWYQNNHTRTRNNAILKQELEATFVQRETSQWLELLGEQGIPCGPINNVMEVINDPQVKARNMLVTCDDPIAGKVTMAGNPIKLSSFPDPTTRPPAPSLDQHKEALRKELGLVEA